MHLAGNITQFIDINEISMTSTCIWREEGYNLGNILANKTRALRIPPPRFLYVKSSIHLKPGEAKRPFRGVKRPVFPTARGGDRGFVQTHEIPLGREPRALPLPMQTRPGRGACLSQDPGF